MGPDFTRPSSPDTVSYDGESAADQVIDPAQTLKSGGDIPAQWWALFHSPALSQLVAQSVARNPDLDAADAALRAAQANENAGITELFPTIGGSLGAQREKSSGATAGGLFPGTIFNLYNATASVSYGFDLWGGTRRGIEELAAQTDQAEFEKRAAYVTLTGNVVTAAITEAGLRDQIAATETIVADQEKILALFRTRLAAGAIARTAVLQQETSLANAQAQLPMLRHQLAVTRHLLSVLGGQLPSQAPDAEFHLSDLTLPAEVPVSLPSRLVEQRPDIRAAEADLHAASAAIGVAEAARLPQITLTADIGSMANKIGNLFTPGSGIWAFGGSVSQSLFDAGALGFRTDAARANYDAAAARYRKTVLAAFQNVADTLHALQSDADMVKARQTAASAANEGLRLAQVQFKSGAIASIDLLQAEQSKQQAAIALIQAQTQRHADTAALLVALGGGWWNADTVPETANQNISLTTQRVKENTP